TKIKGLFQVLPTKTELYKRKPNIYSDPYCVLCTDQVAKTLDHLTCCRALEHIWLELEAQAISLAWAHLKDETRAVITLRDL
ncbi:42133_t:CDS:1, partial [Gigaspora margarita]